MTVSAEWCFFFLVDGGVVRDGHNFLAGGTEGRGGIAQGAIQARTVSDSDFNDLREHLRRIQQQEYSV